VNTNLELRLLTAADLQAPGGDSALSARTLSAKQRKAVAGALARRRLEIYQERKWLFEALYDVLEDSESVH